MHLKSWMRMTLFLTVAAVLLLFSCEQGSEESGGGGARYEIKFMSALEHPTQEKPAPTAAVNAPVITDLTYTKVTRQGGDFTGAVTFTDLGDYTKVTTLLLAIDQGQGFMEFPVVPFQDPLTSRVKVNFSLRLSDRFLPGIFTFYLGLKDTDGNVSNYLHRVLIVKSLADLAVVSLTPLDQTAEASLNLTVRADFSQQVFRQEASIALFDGPTPVPGTSYMSANGMTLTFIPDSFLQPDTAYRVTVSLLVNGKSLTHSFTTESAPPLSNPGDLIGKTFSVELSADNLIEPAEGRLLFDAVPVLPVILIKALVLSGDTLTTLSAAGEDNGSGGIKQISLVPTFGPSAANFMDPYFLSGPSDMVVDLSALGYPGSIAVHDIFVSGRFVENAGGLIQGFTRASFSGYVDAAEVNAIISYFAVGSKVQVCEILPVCDPAGLIRIRAEELEGNWEQGIAHLYDMSCAANPDTVNAVAGGSLQVTCTTQEDASGYQGGNIKFLAQTGTFPNSHEVGTWDTTGYSCSGAPPVCAVPDASGQINLTLTLASGDLASGDISFRVGGITTSPIGDMTRTQSVAVQ